MNVSFTKYNEEFLAKSYQWLSDAEIKYLTNTPPITRRSQKEWFQKLPLRTDYLIWGICKDGEPIGAVGLKHIDSYNKIGEYFGYIGEKRFWGMGFGKLMISFIETKAKELSLSTLQLVVRTSNHRAIHLYVKSGFAVDNHSSNEPSDFITMTKTI